MNKLMPPSWLRRTATIVAVVMGLQAMTAPARGGLIASQPVAVSAVSADGLARAQQILELKVVQQRLHDLGFNEEDVQARLLRADPADLHQFAMQSDQILAGGDAIGMFVGVLLIVLLVIVILKVADKQIVIT